MDRPVDDFLEHYGVAGMKWGKRKGSSGATTATPKLPKAQDHLDAQALKKLRPSQMSNADLKKLNGRMQLEQTYSELMSKQGSKIGKGQGHVKKVLSVSKTISDVYNVINSPAGKAFRAIVLKV